MYTSFIILHLIILVSGENRSDYDPNKIYPFEEINNLDYSSDLYPDETELSKGMYLYTKRRMEKQNCNDNTVWSWCICQFSCFQPEIVDCYYPCEQGCQCKDDFVFDPISEDCILPEHCDLIEDYAMYQK